MTVADWTYTVSVRSLCEFTAKRGDLDRRFTPSATALEGLQAQAAVAARRGPGYETEVALEARCGELRVRGRADGFDAPRRCVEEVKTIRGLPESIPENRRHLHWAQLQTYGALMCQARGLEEVDLALVYVDALTQAETVLRQRCGAGELQAAFEARCQAFADWARQEAAHRRARDAALAALPFPPGEFRPGQRGLAEAVYRSTAAGRCLLAQAPTGIGKTIGTLYPALRALPGAAIDKLAFLTCKGSGRVAALEALGALHRAAAGTAPRVLVLMAKDQACRQPDKACHGDSCPLARGFYDRLPAARAEAVALGWLDPAAQLQVAQRHGLCPYYLGHELLRWADVVVADVHHAFDPHGQLHGLMQALDWRLALLVDEAHNLVERTRRMYGATLDLAQADAALPGAPASVQAAIQRWCAVAGRMAAQQAADYTAYDSVPDELLQPLLAMNAAIGDHLQAQPAAATGSSPLLGWHFQALKLQRALERFGSHSVFDVERGAAGQVQLNVRNVVPAPFLRPRFEAFHASVLFSATLGAAGYQRDLLGLPASSAWIDVPPAFAPEHLQVRIAARLSTRWQHRRASLAALADLLARQYRAHPGNYLAFFSSFDYLAQAAQALALRHPGLPQWRQARSMDEASRQDFIARFVPAGRGIGFAVLGGAFAEGVDLPGTRLIGAFVATLGLPPVSPVQDQFKARLEAMFGPAGHADLLPGLQKVVQAAGRVLRTPEDRGWLWLIDDRFARPEVRALLPAWWQVEVVGARPTRTSADPPREIPDTGRLRA